MRRYQLILKFPPLIIEVFITCILNDHVVHDQQVVISPLMFVCAFFCCVFVEGCVGTYKKELLGCYFLSILHQTMNFHLLNYKQRSFEKKISKENSHCFCTSMWLPLSI
jgi:hypothetical protein